MSSKRQIKITEADLIFIYGNDYQLFLNKIIPNCHCVKCASPYTSPIVNYKIFLNDLNDLILKGFCAKCQSPVNRYLETGEISEYSPRINKIRKKYRFANLIQYRISKTVSAKSSPEIFGIISI